MCEQHSEYVDEELLARMELRENLEDGADAHNFETFGVSALPGGGVWDVQSMFAANARHEQGGNRRPYRWWKQRQVCSENMIWGNKVEKWEARLVAAVTQEEKDRRRASVLSATLQASATRCAVEEQQQQKMEMQREAVRAAFLEDRRRMEKSVARAHWQQGFDELCALKATFVVRVKSPVVEREHWSALPATRERKQLQRTARLNLFMWNRMRRAEAWENRVATHQCLRGVYAQCCGDTGKRGASLGSFCVHFCCWFSCVTAETPVEEVAPAPSGFRDIGAATHRPVLCCVAGLRARSVGGRRVALPRRSPGCGKHRRKRGRHSVEVLQGTKGMARGPLCDVSGSLPLLAVPHGPPRSYAPLATVLMTPISSRTQDQDIGIQQNLSS